MQCSMFYNFFSLVNMRDQIFLYTVRAFLDSRRYAWSISDVKMPLCLVLIIIIKEIAQD